MKVNWYQHQEHGVAEQRQRSWGRVVGEVGRQRAFRGHPYKCDNRSESNSLHGALRDLQNKAITLNVTLALLWAPSHQVTSSRCCHEIAPRSPDSPPLLSSRLRGGNVHSKHLHSITRRRRGVSMCVLSMYVSRTEAKARPDSDSGQENNKR